MPPPLSDEKRQAILAAHKEGLSFREIAKAVSVSDVMASRIVAAVFGRLSPDEIAARHRRGQAKKSRMRQAEKIAAGDFLITTTGDVAVATIKDTSLTFDAVDVPLLHRFAWNLGSNRRLFRQIVDERGARRNIYIYHDILGVEPSRSLVVDHINRDPTDNRRSNLRLVTQSENSLNRSPRRSHAASYSNNRDHNYA